MLPAEDVEFLTDRFSSHDVTVEAGMTCVLVSAFVLPSGLNLAASDLLVRLSPGYPDIPPDMFWFGPALSRSDGAIIDRADVTEIHLGRQWQRWSRHMSDGSWSSGSDGLRSYFTLIEKELLRAALRTAA